MISHRLATGSRFKAGQENFLFYLELDGSRVKALRPLLKDGGFILAN